MRIVSLACSNTEIVCALGCADMLVGVDDHSDYPAEVVSELPKVGPDLEIDVDRVAALEPDLVLATLTVPGHEEVVEKLKAAGLPFIAPEPVSLEDVYRDIREIADRLGVAERAEPLIRGMRSELGGAAEPATADTTTATADTTTATAPPTSTTGDGTTAAEDPVPGAGDGRPTILVQWWPKPVITPGRRSWATDVIRAAGGRALLGDEDLKSRPMSDDEVAEADPDAVVLSWCGVHPDKYRPDVVLGNERWQDLDFVKEGRVYCVGEPFLGRPGPRLVEGVRAMRRVVEELKRAPV